MQSVEQVIVDIDEDANVTVDVKHSAGAKCKKLTDAFRGLGKVTEEKLKPEFYEAAPAHATTGVRQKV